MERDAKRDPVHCGSVVSGLGSDTSLCCVNLRDPKEVFAEKLEPLSAYGVLRTPNAHPFSDSTLYGRRHQRASSFLVLDFLLERPPGFCLRDLGGPVPSRLSR